LEMKEQENWDLIIEQPKKAFSFKLKEIWAYRDLLEMFIRRDIVTIYKQTILGPVWFFIQPAFTTIVYILIFGKLARISTDGLPPALFYLAGITLWNYFSETLTKTSDTFSSNQHIFGKVYFPRLIAPLAATLQGLIKMLIQFILFMVVYVFFAFKGSSVSPNWYAMLFPLLIAILGGLALGFGIIISSLTTKYRDLKFLIIFAVQLWMYATPVIYPLSAMKGDYSRFIWILQANPLTAVMETFKYGFLGQGTFSWFALGYSMVFTIIIMVLGILVFNRIERKFMDTI